jgi:hypothetical protein
MTKIKPLRECHIAHDEMDTYSQLLYKFKNPKENKDRFEFDLNSNNLFPELQE